MRSVNTVICDDGQGPQRKARPSIGDKSPLRSKCPEQGF
jgi:hypothetical protein